MDLTIPTAKTPDADTPTPPTLQMGLSNGSLKRHAPPPASQPPPPPPPPSLAVVCYRECLKNHAAGIGGYALDGCGEFMSSPTSISTNPTSLKCVACGCHRNFHRREFAQDSNPNSLNRLRPSPPKSAPAVVPPPQAPPQRGFPSPSSSTSPSGSPRCSIPSPESSPSPPPISQFSAPTYHASAPQILLSLGNSYDTAVAAEDLHRRSLIHRKEVKSENPCGRKRSRTKFSREQKEKMFMFCEKLGWKMQRVEERVVQDFCNEVDVSRYVFKVWMHNNKNKRSGMHRAVSADHGCRDGLNSYNFDGTNNVDIQLKKEDSYGDVHVSANGSSP